MSNPSNPESSGASDTKFQTLSPEETLMLLDQLLDMYTPAPGRSRLIEFRSTRHLEKDIRKKIFQTKLQMAEAVLNFHLQEALRIWEEAGKPDPFAQQAESGENPFQNVFKEDEVR